MSMRKLLITVLAIINTLALVVGASGCVAAPQTPIAESEEDNRIDRGLAETGQVYDPGASNIRPADGMTPASMRNLTIMIYMIGSNLESNYGKATADLEEIYASGYDKGVLNVIVFTGGSRRWTGNIPSERNCILDMGRPDETRIVARTEVNADMGAPGTLSAFIDFCDLYYPSERQALILWDHGGGPLFGYGADELFESDSLLLSEMQSAMKQTRYGNANKLAFVGFDACIMSCIENMNVWKDYADYMIASEELEPGDGWNYSFLGRVDADTETQSICENIVESFEEYYISQESDTYHPDLTLSCVDLNRLDTLNTAIDKWSAKCLNALESGKYSNIAKSRSEVKGVARSVESDKNEGLDSYDIIDIGDMAEKMKWIGESESVDLQNAISDVIVRNYSNVENLSGITMYYPAGNKSQYRSNIKNYEDVVVSRSYQRFLNKSSEEWLTERNLEWSLPEIDQDENGYYVQLPEEQMDSIAAATYSVLAFDDFFGYIPMLENISVIPDDAGRVYLPKDIEIITLGEDGLKCSVRELEASDNRYVYCTEGLRVNNSPLLLGGIMNGSRRQEVQTVLISKDDNLIIQSINAEDGDISLAGKNTIDIGQWCGIEQLVTGVVPGRDVNGRLLPTTEWPDSGTYGWISGNITKGMKFVKKPLDHFDGEFVAQIQVEDVYGDVYASELIDLNNQSTVTKASVSTAEGELTFSVYDDYAVCTTYYGDEEEVIIPDSVNGKPVRRIGDSAFSGTNKASPHQKLASVVLPTSLEYIGDYAFAGCTVLENINIPDGVTGIGAGAFQYCKSLKHIALPATLSFIDVGVFAGCDKMLSIEVDNSNQTFCVIDDALYSKDGNILYAYPTAKTGSYSIADGTEEIAYAAFADSRISEVILPDSIQIIGDFAFYDADLESPPTLPDSLIEIGDNAFSCAAGTVKRSQIESEPVTIMIGANVRTIGMDAFDLFMAREYDVSTDNPCFSSIDGNLMSKAGDILIDYATRRENILIIPNGTVEFDVKRIETLINKLSLFETDIIHIQIPSSVIRFPADPGMYPNKMIIHCEPGSIAETYARDNDINFSYDLDSDIFPEKYGEITSEQGKFRYELYTDHAVIVYCEVPEDMADTAPEEYAIEFPSIIEEKPVTVIGNGLWCVFDEEHQSASGLDLDTIIIPEGVTKISDYALNVVGPTCVRLPSTLKSIGDEAIGLSGSDSTPLAIPEGIENLGEAFVIIPTLDGGIRVTSSLKDVSPGAFRYCKSLEEFEADGDNSLYSVKEGMLYSADGTILIAAPDGVGEIPEGTIEIGDRAFDGRVLEKELIIPESVEKIGEYAFNNTSGLERIVFSKEGKLNTISDRAFSYSKDLLEISLPDTVTDLGEFVFSECDNLQIVALPQSISEIHRGMFDGCEQLRETRISSEIKRIEEWAYSRCSSIKDMYIPNTVKEISPFAFSNTELNFEIDPENPYYEVIDGFLIDKCKMMIVSAKQPETGVIRVPEGIIDIGVAFSDMEGITDIYLPASVVRIVSLPRERGDDGYKYTMVIHGERGTYAERYAGKNEIEFKEE